MGAMNEQQSFLDAILAEPEDDGLRLVYADWLEENGQGERAEFIRVQIELHQEWPWAGQSVKDGLTVAGREAHPQFASLVDRERELLDTIGSWPFRWFPGPSSIGTENVDHAPPRSGQICRGFVERITLSAEDWLRHADAITACQPIREVRLTTRLATDQIFARIPDEMANRLIEGWAIRRLFSEYVNGLLTAAWPRIKFTLPEHGRGILRDAIEATQLGAEVDRAAIRAWAGLSTPQIPGEGGRP